MSKEERTKVYGKKTPWTKPEEPQEYINAIDSLKGDGFDRAMLEKSIDWKDRYLRLHVQYTRLLDLCFKEIPNIVWEQHIKGSDNEKE